MQVKKVKKKKIKSGRRKLPKSHRHYDGNVDKLTMRSQWNLWQYRTLAAFDEYGSSNMDHSWGLNRCHQVSLPCKNASSKPNFRAISSSLGFSVSKSRRSKTASVSCVSLCCEHNKNVQSLNHVRLASTRCGQYNAFEQCEKNGFRWTDCVPSRRISRHAF